MRTDAGGVLLALAGGVVAQVTLSGEFQNYVRTGLRPWLLLAAVGLVLVGGVRVVQRLRHPDDHHGPAPHAARLHTHGPLAVDPEVLARARRTERRRRQHDHSRVPPVAWLLAVPVLLLLVVPPPALGAFAAARGDGSIPGQVGSQTYAPLPVRDPVPLQVHDYAVRAAWDGGRTLINREMVLTGFVTPAPDGGWYVTRAVLTCCAADAQSYPVRVVGDSGSRTADTWVQVTGRFVPAEDPGRHTAAIQALAIRPVPQPAQPYEQ